MPQKWKFSRPLKTWNWNAKNEKAIAARVEANRKAEFSARERLSKAHARYTAPESLEDFDAAMEAMAAAERDIAVAEREARPLKHLHETARNATRLALEFLREAPTVAMASRVRCKAAGTAIEIPKPR
jgi:hypothetical protein